MLSLTCKNAIKSVIYLASQAGSGENAGLKEVAAFIEASEHTVGKLLQTLVRQKVINSIKGPSGGFYITKEQLKQPVIKIITAIDGGQMFQECGLGLSRCSSSHPCPLHNEYAAARKMLENLFKRNRIIDLCDPVNEGLAYLAG